MCHFVGGGDMNLMAWMVPYEAFGSEAAYGAVMDSSKDLTVENLYATDTYKDYILRMYKWRQDGIIAKDATDTSSSTDYQYSQQLFCGQGDYTPQQMNDNQVVAAQNGFEYGYMTLVDSSITNSTATEYMWGIATNSERPDKAMNLEKPEYPEYMKKLSQVSGVEIADFADLKEALLKRMEFFAQMGCSVSDHALEYVMYAPAAEEKVNEIFKKRLNGESISREEEMIFKTAFMQFVGKEYHKKNWVMQIHYGCKRDNNAFMYEQLGPDTGYDCINNYAPSAQTADFLNSLIASNELPKTILYSLNPNDNEAIGTILGCFQGTEAAGKIQQGSAWWFNDHKTGMIAQMTSLANLGLLANFVGMLTDSRSFLSYTRHEYFRRILCELIGGWVENGEYPADYKTLKEIVCGISYNNAVDYFGFDL